MEDLISRKDLLVPLNRLIAEFEGKSPIFVMNLTILLTIRNAVERMPAVNHIECKNCKHHDSASKNCDFLCATTDDNWFCWNGEEKRNNGKE